MRSVVRVHFGPPIFLLEEEKKALIEEDLLLKPDSSAQGIERLDLVSVRTEAGRAAP